MSIHWVNNIMACRGKGPSWLTEEATASVRRFHRTVPEYRMTPLVALPDMARRLGVGGLYIKDESQRFGLNAFKTLGGVYAVSRAAAEALGWKGKQISFSELMAEDVRQRLASMVFVTATDGNHGRGVAWAAGLLGCRAVVYMPRGSSPLRAAAIRQAGEAEVMITDLSYDDAVRKAAADAKAHGWHLIQDTAWPGYERVPQWIVEGYSTMVWEALLQMGEYGAAPTHVFLQAGVGAMAGSAAGYLANAMGEWKPLMTTVEPVEAACLYESVKAADGKPHAATGSGKTIMAGLNCGEPCMLTWPILRDEISWAVAATNDVAARGMRLLAAPRGGDGQIISGESGAAAMGVLSCIMEDPALEALRENMKLDRNASVLLFNTEGDTDTAVWRRVVYDGAWPYKREDRS